MSMKLHHRYTLDILEEDDALRGLGCSRVRVWSGGGDERVLTDKRMGLAGPASPPPRDAKVV